jgi:putative pyruvate formate lyase activating enzyme
MKCIFCQNHEISQPAESFTNEEQTVGDVVHSIKKILAQGIKAVGFVSPSHMAVQMKAIIAALHSSGLYPTIIYNTNSYDKIETLRGMEGLVDVYLPDYKYVTPELASMFSGVPRYPQIALKALKEMYYQKGSSMITDEEGRAESGMIIRHLVLPGHADESKKVLRSIAEELSTGIHISLMSQYHPAWKAISYPPLDRQLYSEEYEEIAAEMQALGFRNGYIQGMDSNINYLPDFSKEHPFE